MARRERGEPRAPREGAAEAGEEAERGRVAAPGGVPGADELRAVCDAFAGRVYVSDPETHALLFVNRVLSDEIGEALGQKCYFALHGRGSPCPFCTNDRIFGSPPGARLPRCEPVSVETRDPRSGRWHLRTSRAILWPDGRHVRLEFATDITDHRFTDLALKASERKYRRVLENAQEGILILQDGVVRYFNPKFLQMSGYDAGEVAARPFIEFVHPDDQVLVADRYARRLRGEVIPESYRFRVVVKGGEARWVEIRAVRFEWDGWPATLNFIVDVTEQKLADDALKSREMLLQSTLESTADGILVVGSDGRVTHSNRRFAEMWRIPNALLVRGDDEALLSYVLDQLCDPESFLTKVQALYKSADEDFNTISFKDGRTFERYSCPLVQDNQVCGRVWSFRDVTEHLRADLQIRESEGRHRMLFDTANDAILVLRGEEIIDANPRALRMFGCERDDLVGRTPAELSPPTQPEGASSSEAAARWISAANAGEAQSFEWVHRRRDGSLFSTEVSLNGFELAGDRYIQAIVRDITELKQAQEVQSVLLAISQALADTPGLADLLAAIHRELGRLIDTTNFYVALYDEASDTYTFPYHIDQIDDLDSLEPIRLKKSLTDYVRRTGRPLLVDEEVHRRLEQSGEIELVGAPSPIWLGVPLSVGHRVIGVVAVQSYVEGSLYTGRDLEIMTFVSGSVAVAIERVRAKEERERLQAQIQHAQKLESLGVLAGGIAHDFNNLLTGILGNADLALVDLDAESPAVRSLTEIKSAAERAAELSRQMLAYSGKGSFVIETIHLNEVLLEMANLLEASISKRAVIRYDLDDGVPPIVGDATQIRQVIMNLITNASDALCGKDGVISIASGVTECDAPYLRKCYLVGEVRPGRFAYLDVSDTGCGMDEATKQRIFDPFFTTKFTGRGLGLASTLGIVRGHGGTLHVTSAPGRGTTFRVLFPTGDATRPVEAAPERVPTAIDEGPPKDAGTVLVVDDEQSVREVASRMLEQVGLTVASVSDGREAVEFFRLHADEIGCVLLDLTMPYMSGEETLRELRGIREDVPVLLSSGYSEKEVADRFDGLVISGFVQKPYRVARLVSQVGAALRNGASGVRPS